MNKRRVDTDVLQLMESNHEVTLINGLTDFYVKVPGPSQTPYEGAVWRVRVTLPDGYPFKSPSVSFMDPIIHPNVEENSGAICLDVLNETWSPLYSLINVFDTFLPQLLTYPNPDHALNRHAATIAIKEPEIFDKMVRDSSAKLAEITKNTNNPELLNEFDEPNQQQPQHQPSPTLSPPPQQQQQAQQQSLTTKTTLQKHEQYDDIKEAIIHDNHLLIRDQSDHSSPYSSNESSLSD